MKALLNLTTLKVYSKKYHMYSENRFRQTLNKPDNLLKPTIYKSLISNSLMFLTLFNNKPLLSGHIIKFKKVLIMIGVTVQ